MARLPLRVLVLDTACSVAGRIGRALGHKLTRPVFIVGTGRCGTTLLVRMLNSHRGLSGVPDEANELWHPALEPFETSRLPTPPIEVDPVNFSEVSLAHWPSGQGERIRDVFSGFQLLTGRSKVFFTKSAMVSHMIPVILKLFPDARIIHIYRFGPAVVKSYVEKNFGKYSRFAFAKKDYKAMCARYWNACILEIDQRTKALPKDQFLEFSYEELCRSPRAVLDDVARLVGVSPGGFEFDLSEVSNQNFKADVEPLNAERAELLALMAPGLEMKGYASGQGDAIGA